MQTATFGLGCFWTPDAQFGALEGVVRTRVGYTGGTTPDPSYHKLGDHCEAVQLDFDSALISYSQLLQEALRGGRFGRKDGKRQYRSVIFYHSSEQRSQAQAAGILELEAAGPFTRAEDYLQKHFLQHGPEGREFLERYPGIQAFIDSTEVARANAIASGSLTLEQIQTILPALDVSPRTRQIFLQNARTGPFRD